ncbi:hypothetical protein DFH28DRAFT_1104226 [Melampsora americana]|nr:hypothetical protein DFH28DRAFT_1104226 [Melampsora americana]
MDFQSLFLQHKPRISTEAYCSPEFICKLHETAKCIPQLKRTGENFNLWQRHLKAMIGSLTGSSDYFQQELAKHEPKFNRAIFHLMFWSIEEALQEDLKLDGSAGEVFQILSDRFQSKPSIRCIMSRTDFPEEILENIVNILYYTHSEEKDYIRQKKQERLSLTQDQERQIYSNHGSPPILNSFQTLAVVNRKFHRLCLRKLWQHIRFPSTLPGPVSLWTEDILLRHGHLVRSLELGLEDLTYIEDEELSKLERSHQDNTSPCSSFVDPSRQGIGVLSMEKLFRACPDLDSVVINIPDYSDELDLFSSLERGLANSFRVIPQLQHLTLRDVECSNLPGVFVIKIIGKLPSLVSLELVGLKFGSTESIRNSLGWNLAQCHNLRKLRLDCVTCEDQTWTLNSWPQRLTTLDFEYCPGLKPDMVQKLLSGSAPVLTSLRIFLEDWEDDSDVNGQTDLPALERLILCDSTSFNLLLSFRGCKEITMIDYGRLLKNDQWNLIRHLLSICTWPKLSSLHLSGRVPSLGSKDRHDWRQITKKDVYAVWYYLRIQLFIK